MRGPCFKALFEKSTLKIRTVLFFRRKVGKRTFVPNTPIYFGEAFEVPRNFPEKFLVSGIGADAPTSNAHTKKHGDAVLFIFCIKNLPQNIFAGDLLFYSTELSALFPS